MYDEVILYLKIASIVMSVLIAGFICRLGSGRGRRSPQLLFWALAWVIVALRVLVQLLSPSKPPDEVLQSDLLGYFLGDVLTVLHDLLWFVGLAIVLEFSTAKRVYFPIAYMAVHSIIVGTLYFSLNNTILAAIETTMIAHPLLLFVLFWYFYVTAQETKRWGTSLVAASFLLWALDYIVFGVPYFGIGIGLAGALGWIIGFVFRTMILIGFIFMVIEQEELDY
ncbi:MAG: hypothetical protein AB1665_05330 [Candidatus Thermoplasmatota archaeon]